MKKFLVSGAVVMGLFLLPGCGSGEEEESTVANDLAEPVIPEPNAGTAGVNSTVNLASDSRIPAGEQASEETGNDAEDGDAVARGGDNEADAQVSDVSDDESPDVVEESEEREESERADVALATLDTDAPEEVEEDSHNTEVEEADAGTENQEEWVADVSTETVDLADLDLNGTATPDGLALTTFLAENSDGGSRTEIDLIGKPTVLWFFPFAGTPG